MVGHDAMGHNDRHTVSHQLRLWLRKLLLNLFVQNKKITRRTTTSERKHVFASLSKFQIENVRKQVTCT